MGVYKKDIEEQKNRLGIEKLNNDGELMKIISYNNSKDIIVEFQDEYKEKIHSCWYSFKNGSIRNPITKNNLQDKYNNRLGTIIKNHQNIDVKIIKYVNANNITVKFLDKYGCEVKCTWRRFINGIISNPYYPTVHGCGIVGNKYPVTKNGEKLKEYKVWAAMIQRCFDTKFKNRCKQYQDATCCEEWLLYENFYEWLHSQENFDKWYNSDKWELDKDILIKGNKVYSPDTCSLVPEYINILFIKCENRRNGIIGVSKDKTGTKFCAKIHYIQDDKLKITTKTFNTKEEAFYLGYKPSKEKYIKQIAQKEYNEGNITKKCYDAMMNYQVEITD